MPKRTCRQSVPTLAKRKISKVVKLCKKLKSSPRSIRDARLTRRNLSLKQKATPKTLLVYRRARYYSSQLGQFISRDPLGYIDGMSQYRAYFVPGAMDPFGTCASCVTALEERGCFDSRGNCNPNPFNVLDATSIDGLGSMANLLSSPPSVSSPSPSSPGMTAGISFNEDFITVSAAAFSIGIADCHVSINRTKPNYKRAMMRLKTCLKGKCIKDLFFTGHGFSGRFGTFDEETINPTKGDPAQLEFLEFLKGKICRDREVTTTLKTCYTAKGDQNFISEFSQTLDTPVIAWDDVYGVIPFGNRYTAYPDGSVSPPQFEGRMWHDTWRKPTEDFLKGLFK